MSVIDLVPNSDTMSLTCFQVANFQFDIQLSGSHESIKTITENPIESGAKISDHSYLEPKTYTVTGAMTSYEPYDFVGNLIGDDIQFLKSLPIISGIVAKTDQAVARVNLFASKVSRTASTITSTARKFSTYLPDTVAQWLGDETTPTDRMAEAHNTLLSIQKYEYPINITTKLRSYTSMVLIGVQVAESADDRADFTLTFREMTVIETQVVNGLVVPSTTKTATGRAANQTATSKSKGKTSPIKQESGSNKTSALRSMGDFIRSK